MKRYSLIFDNKEFFFVDDNYKKTIRSIHIYIFFLHKLVIAKRINYLFLKGVVVHVSNRKIPLSERDPNQSLVGLKEMIIC